MRGSLSFSPDARSAANANAKKICENAMPRRIPTAEANVNQRALRNNIGSVVFISGSSFSMAD